jgi:hypothetical protein
MNGPTIKAARSRWPRHSDSLGLIAANLNPSVKEFGRPINFE